MSYRAGDVVRLKSGGPEMTVQPYREDDHSYCQWFDVAELRWDAFHDDSLVVVRPFQAADPAGDGAILGDVVRRY